MPAKYVCAYSKGQKNDFRDAEAIAEVMQRLTMKFVATKTADQLDLQALHRVRERLVRQSTSIINQIRAFLLGRRIAVRQGFRCPRTELPGILAKRSDALSPRIMRLIEDLAGSWCRLDKRIEVLSTDIASLVEKDPACERLMTVPRIGPIISSPQTAPAMCSPKGRDFAAWLGLVPRQISTGDRTILGKISKRGNHYLRALFVQAASANAQKRPDTLIQDRIPPDRRTPLATHGRTIHRGHFQPCCSIAPDCRLSPHSFRARCQLRREGPVAGSIHSV